MNNKAKVVVVVVIVDFIRVERNSIEKAYVLGIFILYYYYKL